MQIPDQEPTIENWFQSPWRNHWQDYRYQLGCLRIDLLANFPDFLFVSPAKTGSTWLAQMLKKHEKIAIPSCKELRYFDIFWHWFDINWYLEHFDQNISIRGDATPSAMLPDRAIQALQILKPNLKLIFIMRDPIARAFSQIKHQFKYHRQLEWQGKSGDFCDLSREDILRSFVSSSSLSIGDYEKVLRRWLKFFPPEQFFIAFLEEFEDAPEAHLNRLFEFLGVPPILDFSEFSIREKVLVGLQLPPPNWVEEVLGIIYAHRVDRLRNLLIEKFNLHLPPRWNVRLQSISDDTITICPEDRGLKVMYDARQGLFATNCSSPEKVYGDVLEEIHLKVRLSSLENGFESLESLDWEHEQLTYTLSVWADHEQPSHAFNRTKLDTENSAKSYRLLWEPRVRLLDSWHGYNFLEVDGDGILAVSQALGPRHLYMETLGEQELAPLLFKGDSVVEVLKKIEDMELHTGRQRETLSIQLMMDFHGYNILQVEEKFFAVLQSLGPTHLFRETIGERELADCVLLADTVDELKQRIERIRVTNKAVTLVKSLSGYNLLQVDSSYFLAVAQSLGAIQLLPETIGEQGLGNLVLLGNTMRELEQYIEQIKKTETYSSTYSPAGKKVIFVERCNGYNFLQIDNEYFIAISQSLGRARWFSRVIGKQTLIPSILQGDNIEELRHYVGSLRTRNWLLRMSTFLRSYFRIGLES